ncbi:MAG: hypothetical protein PF572_06760 [Patescibacteria group bacterium]|jgi:VIT1/CCC1 family predicted Fe2+/Mn2+ transporter|nr:hypothetical protein [Patescibacteria group bacterium]
MRKIFKSGVSFGLTSATITTLGLIIGLYSSTNSKSVVFGGILIIALADAFSDSLGVHVAEESKNNSTEKEIWALTIFTLLSKFFFALTYAIPFMFFEMKTAIIVDIVWGYFLLGYLSYSISKGAKTPCWKIISEHLTIATFVIAATYYIGHWVSHVFV